MAETVLVTGGTGFIGGWCILELLRRGYGVRTTVRSLAREKAVRDALAPHAVSLAKLSFVAADLTRDDGLGRGDGLAATTCCTWRRRSELAGSDSPQALIGPAREGTLRVLQGSGRGRGEAGGLDLLLRRLPRVGQG